MLGTIKKTPVQVLKGALHIYTLLHLSSQITSGYMSHPCGSFFQGDLLLPTLFIWVFNPWIEKILA